MLQKVKSLVYPFSKNADFGEPVEVAEGVFLLKMPIPFALDHINLWLLRDDDGWVIVDTGFYSVEAASIWKKVLGGFCQGKTVHKIIVTHFHPDHVGMADLLMRQTQATLFMSKLEFLSAQLACQPFTDKQTAARHAYYQRFGLTAKQVSELVKRKLSYVDGVPEAPVSYQRLADGQSIHINNEHWQCHRFSGHSPEHICLYNMQQKILISGDQVLPNISPNISVVYSEPEANPLAEYLDSLSTLSEFDEDILVLPSHGRVFKGLQQRTQQLVDGHQEHLQQLREFCQKSRTGKEVIEKMFGDRLSLFNLSLATGEAMAHLNYLIGLGELGRTDGPVDHYKTI